VSVCVCVCDGARGPHPAAGFDPLVHVVGERLPGHEAPRALGGVDGPFLQHDLALADDHQGAAAHLRALKDVVLHVLGGERFIISSQVFIRHGRLYIHISTKINQ